MSEDCPRCATVDGGHYCRASINEDGWYCGGCATKLGYRPDLDRELIESKVMGFLMDLHTENLVYVSNSDMGDYIAAGVARRCRELGRYDQQTILKEIFADPNMGAEGHAAYWAKQAAEVPK